MSIYVFVYGTLRAGEINDLAQAAARRGLPAARHVGPASVPGRLVDFGDWPGLIPVDDGRRVRGDIFQVEPALVALMDEIEEYESGKPCCFVRREVVARLEPPAQAPELRCQYYPIDPALRGAAVDIAADDWVAYRLARPLSDAP
ncbi:gamma-glutamylcyclotransferase [Achromobacter sp. ACM04]|uniref:gamma-glutamylcyclotransferase family protein n=1 Tax=unclassified Achromobacter TaxID=2626865 RepID=UPI00177D3B3D|nr:MULTISPECIES: gamma-glutamylcyclotransferase family protein [unclassified Achromobacter]MBD9419466.1 gamma-glutamylcyclotransferase [Achromobacter sp. ACM04]MBD9476101.1 gamma-glutamylcyclotransferase [Achromobacter sp. ACM01]